MVVLRARRRRRFDLSDFHGIATPPRGSMSARNEAYAGGCIDQLAGGENGRLFGCDVFGIAFGIVTISGEEISVSTSIAAPFL